MRRLFIVSSFFLIALFTVWLSHSATAVELPKSEEAPRFYSNQTGDDLHLLFCEALAQADQSIFLEMYAVTDPDIVSILKKQSEQGRRVDILSDATASPGLKKRLGPSVNLEWHEGKGLMHRKIVVIDDELVLLGSTNFTKSSLGMHDNLVIALREKNFAQFCKSDSSFYANDALKAWKLPESGKMALEAACALLASAQKTIRVAMFTFTHARLAGELIEAHKRGIDVQVALDHYTREGSSKKIADLLIAAGVPVWVSQGMQLLHHKWALIDDKILLAGSANWTQSAFRRNKDLLMAITPLNDEESTTMQHLWSAIRLTAN